MTASNLWERVRKYFNLMPDKEDEREIVEQISSGVSFRGANLWVLIFAIFIASLGLNVNSTAVIIGAMLISPLMGPIVGMGLAVGTNDLGLLKRAGKNFGVATLISVLTATIYFLVTPLSEAQSELLARTSPTLYDVLIAFCGGAAGIIALCTRGKGNVIPGVAIATALMPPLCTAGFGLATGHFLYFLGAFYLFYINTVFIALATYCGVRLMKFHTNENQVTEKTARKRRILMSFVVVTLLPAAYMTIHIVQESIFENNVNKFVKAELTQRGTQIITSTVDKDSLRLRVVAVGREISSTTQAAAQSRMKDYGLGDYTLRIIQGTQSDSVLALTHQVTSLTTSRESEQRQLVQLSAENTLLSQQLNDYKRYETLAAEIRPELHALFPHVNKIALQRVAEVNRDSTDTHHYVAAIIDDDGRRSLSHEETEKLHDWLQARLKADSLVVIKRE
ncbi:MAG: DUF389 domain-containing protein [Prevotella sp.]|nr:DUF389 domain-containing protein [Prevotella sp.]